MNKTYLRYLTICVSCGGNTSVNYARTHDSKCKTCVIGNTIKSTPTRQERILDAGYQAYAREEGHYDGGN
jgi:hypothetical protein